MQVTIIILAGCLNTWQWRTEMTNWARVPYTVSLLTVMMYIERSNMIRFSLCYFWHNCYQYTVPEQLIATIKGQIIVRTSWICSPSWWCSSFADNGLVNWDSLPLQSESPGYRRRVFSNYWVCHGEVITDVVLWAIRGRWWRYLPWLLMIQLTWDWGGGGVVFDFVCCSIPLSHQLSLSLSQTLSLAPSNIQRCSPCLCAGCSCLIACSPSRFSDIVVVCLYWLVCVTCICPDSLEGVCFCSQCCKQGAAPFPNHSVGDGYFHRSYFFFFIISVNRLAWDRIMCLRR